jgi:hypothetical protein
MLWNARRGTAAAPRSKAVRRSLTTTSVDSRSFSARSRLHRAGVLRIVSLLTLVVLVDCDCDDEGVSALQAILVADRTTVDFTEAFVGASLDEAIRLQNLGGAPLTIVSLEVATSGPFRLVSPPPTSIAGGGEASVVIRFSPTTIASFESTLRIVSDADNARELSIRLRATGRDALSCDDDNACTDDRFDAVLGACVHEAVMGTCDDGNACTTNDRCAQSVCVGDFITCDDGDPCTRDVCDATSGCIGLPDPSVCDDGNPCTDDVCLAGGSCFSVNRPDSTLCAAFSCAGVGLCVAGTCVDFDVPDGSPCTDNDACTMSDVCVAGQCAGVAFATPPGMGAIVPLALPMNYAALATVTTASHLFQIAPGALSAFSLADPSTLTLAGTIALPGGYRAESLAAFDDGRVVAVLPLEERVLVVDIDDVEGLHVVAEMPLPPPLSPMAEAGGAISAGDRVVFLYAGSLYAVDEALSLSLLASYADAPDGLSGSPSRAFVYHRTPLLAQASTRVVDVTGPSLIEKAHLDYPCSAGTDDGVRVACRTNREIGGVLTERIALFDASALDAGETTPLAELPLAYIPPRNRLLLVDGYLLLVDSGASALVLVDPLTGALLLSRPLRGRQIRVLDEYNIVSDDGEWQRILLTGAPGAAFDVLPRTDLGSVSVRAKRATQHDDESVWLVGRSSVVRAAVSLSGITLTDTVTLPIEPADAFKSSLLVRLPTTGTRRLAQTSQGGSFTSPMGVFDVSFGAGSLTSTRIPSTAEGSFYFAGGELLLDVGSPIESMWSLFDTSSLFAGSGLLTPVSVIPSTPIIGGLQGIPNVTIQFSNDGLRALLTQTVLEGQTLTRFAVVDLTDPSTPRIGGVPVAPGLTYTVGTLDYLPESSESVFGIHHGGMQEQDHIFVAWTMFTDDQASVLAIDASDPLAPRFAARGRIQLPAVAALPSLVTPLFATSTGRVFFGRGVYGPHPGYVGSVDLGDATPDSVVVPEPENIIELPVMPQSVLLVDGVLVVEGVGYLATVSPPCHP